MDAERKTWEELPRPDFYVKIEEVRKEEETRRLFEELPRPDYYEWIENVYTTVETWQQIISSVSEGGNMSILYALYKSLQHTRERVTPARLIELTGLDFSVEEISSHLDFLRTCGYVYRDRDVIEREYFELTKMGESIARGMERLISVLALGKVPDKMTEEQREFYLQTIYRPCRRIDERFSKGI
jgi:hypothetical protein